MDNKTLATEDEHFSWAEVLEDKAFTIDDLGLSTRATNVLYRYGYVKTQYIASFAEQFRNRDELLKSLYSRPSVGETLVEEIVSKMKTLALKVLSGEIETEKLPEFATTKSIEAREKKTTLIQKLTRIWNADVQKQVEQIIEEAENQESNPN